MREKILQNMQNGCRNMNREIKFRAWKKDNNNMFYDIQNGYLNWHFNDFIMDDESIIMQYTGLKDKNDIAVYEGDILQVDKEYSGEYQPIIIVFEDGCFKGQAYHKLTKPFILEVPISTLEVIGNIYENPELINN